MTTHHATHYPVDILHPDVKPLPLTMNVGGRLVVMDRPMVMGIVNATPDSFYSDSRSQTDDEIARRVRQIIDEGADIIDVGGCSTRPGSQPPSVEEEWERVAHALRVVRQEVETGRAPSENTQRKKTTIISVDTFRAEVAERSVKEYGVQIVNDVSGGADKRMFDTIARLGVVYVLTHNADTPCHGNITVEATRWLAERIDALHQMGVCDVIIDPGFGFGKTMEQNYQLLRELYHLKHEIEAPLMVGFSRKSMIYKSIGITPDESLNGTTVLNTLALERGADILRVHDVKEAVQATILTRF